MDKSELDFQKKFLKECDKYDEQLWHKMPSARFDFWVKRKLWTTVEFAYLLKGKEPLEKNTDKIDFIPGSFVTYFEDLVRFVSDEIILGSLKPICPEM